MAIDPEAVLSHGRVHEEGYEAGLVRAGQAWDGRMRSDTAQVLEVRAGSPACRLRKAQLHRSSFDQMCLAEGLREETPRHRGGTRARGRGWAIPAMLPRSRPEAPESAKAEQGRQAHRQALRGAA